MANLPQSLSMLTAFGGGPGNTASASAAATQDRNKMQSAEQLVLELSNPDLRENALLELSKVQFSFQNLTYNVYLSFYVFVYFFSQFRITVKCHI